MTTPTENTCYVCGTGTELCASCARADYMESIASEDCYETPDPDKYVSIWSGC